MRATLLVLLSALFAAAGASAAYPERTIRLVVAFPPGGTTDVTARLITPRLSEILGRQVIVDNRPGAAATVGTDQVAKSEPDGYTLHMSDTTFGIAAALYPKLPYDALRDFAAITQVSAVPSALVVHPALPAKSVKELLAIARARPGQLNFGSGGVGTPVHMAGELLKIAARIDMVHIPYKGAGPALTDLLGGQLQLMFPTMPSVMPYVKAGRLRALAVTSEKRSAALPEIPTLREAGVPGVVTEAWFGIQAPAATPAAILGRLHEAATRALKDPTLRDRFASEGAQVVANSPEQFKAFIAGEIALWRKVVQTAGLKAEF